MEGAGSPTPGLSRGRGAPCASQGRPRAAPLLCLGRFRGPGSSVLPGRLCFARSRGCRARGSGRGPRGGCPRGALAPVTSQRGSHRGMSLRCQPAAPAAVRLGPAVSEAGGGKAGPDEGRGRSSGPSGGFLQPGVRAQPLRGAPGAGQVPPSGLGAGVPGLPATASAWGLWGDVPVPAALTTLPLIVSKFSHPLSHPSPGPCMFSPAAPAATSLPPRPTKPLLSLLLQTMAVVIARILTLLSFLQCVQRVGDQEDAATQELLQQREEQQRQEVTWLMEQMEQRSQEPCGLTLEGVLLAACRHWWFWSSAEPLLLLLGLYRLRGRRSADCDSGSQRGRASGADEKREEDDWEGKAEPSHTLGQDKPQDKVGTSAASAKPFPRTPF